MKMWLSLSLLLLLSGCATWQSDHPFAGVHQSRPASILVVPVANDSLDVQAPTMVLATLPKRLGERGYYVFGVNTVKMLLEQEGYYDGAEIQTLAPEVLAELFHTDAILYVNIRKWTSEYLLLTVTTRVTLEYRLVGADGQTWWSQTETHSYQPNRSSSDSGILGLVADAVVSAMERADPEFLPLTKKAHNQAFERLPPGHYHPDYQSYYDKLNR